MEKMRPTKICGDPLFKKGSLVEVRSNDPGFDGSWYEAIVLQTPRNLRSRYAVQYKTLLSTPPSSKRSKKEKASSLLEEKISMSLIRPSSPCTRDKNAVFEAYQEVEAFHNDGWWPGVILKKMDEIGDDGSYNYSVAFPLSREVFSFRAYDLRKKMVWVADDQEYSWKSADQLCNYDRDNEEKLYMTTFNVGTRVEVSYDKDNYGACWFVANILQLIGRTYCLVEYDTLRENNNDSTNPSLEEVVDIQYIRPCPPTKMSEPTFCFKELDKVEAFYKSGWFLGVVSTVLPNSMYMIRMSSEQNKEELVPFDRAALRVPLVWEDGRWDEISQDKDDKVVRRSKGRKFKHSKTREADSLTDDQFTQPLKKLKKSKDVNDDKSLHKSAPLHDKDGNSLAYNTVPPSEKRSKSVTVHRNLYQKEYSTYRHKSSPSPDKDENALVKNSLRSTERRSKLSKGRHDLCQKEYSPNSAKKTILPEAKNLSPPNDKDVVGLKEPDSHLSSIASDVCHENAATQIESLAENAEIFEEIINHDIVEIESVSDKGNEFASSKNAMENGSISGNGNEYSLNKALSIEENVTPLVPCSQMTSINLESPISKDKMSKLIELEESASEVLQQFPQKLHFQSLRSLGGAVQKGLSCGLMIAFASLVNSIKDLTINSTNSEFEENFKALNYIEGYGFSTEHLRAHLQKMQDMHTTKHSALIKIHELKKQQEMIKSEVEELESVAMRAEEESMLSKLKFDEILESSS